MIKKFSRVPNIVAQSRENFEAISDASDSEAEEPHVLPMTQPPRSPEKVSPIPSSYPQILPQVLSPRGVTTEASIRAISSPTEPTISRSQSGFLRTSRLTPQPLALTAIPPRVAENAVVPMQPPIIKPITPESVARRQPCNILILGGPQCGKSSLVNAYRATILNNDKWAQAPVGKCGWHGTPNVDAYPSHPSMPAWVLIDTPGRVNSELDITTSDDAILLSNLFTGIQWPTKLLGRDAVSPQRLSEREGIPRNRPHQCIIVITAADIIEDRGFTFGMLNWTNRYTKAPQAPAAVKSLQQLIHHVRDYLDEPPFILVTHMDRFGGTGSKGARSSIVQILSECVPINAVFFASFPPDDTCSARQRHQLTLVDSETRQEILRLHQEILSKVCWSIIKNPFALQQYVSVMGRQ